MEKTNDKPARAPKPMLTERLTPEEIESLRRDASEASDYGRKAFSHLAEAAGEMKKAAGEVSRRLLPHLVESGWCGTLSQRRQAYTVGVRHQSEEQNVVKSLCSGISDRPTHPLLCFDNMRID
jgi:hypothetical protein